MTTEPHAEIFAFAQKAQTLATVLLEPDPVRRWPGVWDVLSEVPRCDRKDDRVVLAMNLRRLSEAFVARNIRGSCRQRRGSGEFTSATFTARARWSASAGNSRTRPWTCEALQQMPPVGALPLASDQRVDEARVSHAPEWNSDSLRCQRAGHYRAINSRGRGEIGFQEHDSP